jgi:Flp pilus assembly protein TadB
LTALDIGGAVLLVVVLAFLFERPRWFWRRLRARRATRRLDHLIKRAEQRRASNG